MRRRNCPAACSSTAATPGRSSIPPAPLQVGLDGFARGILGRVDRFELPQDGTTLRQGEPAFAAIQSGKRIEFVSPVDGVVCAVNERINVRPGGGAEGAL